VLWSLNGLRAAGALLVMLYHVNSWNLQVVRGSSAFYTGVGLFFVLSGFVLTWTARPGTTLRAFYTRRLARIYPNHVVALVLGLLVTVLVLGTQVDVGTVLAGLFLVQAWSPDSSVVFAVNGVAWSLSCEIAFYVAFPALLWALRRVSSRTRAVLAGAALVTPPVIGIVWPSTIALMFHLPLTRLPEFVLGMVTAMAVQEGWRPRVPAPVWLGALAVGVLGAAAVDVHPTALTAVLAAVFAPLAARCAGGDIDGRNRWARHPVVMLGGALSFSFYLVHELVIRALVATPLRGWGTIPLVVVLSVALAFALWRGVEIPARARILAATADADAVAGHGARALRGARHGRPRGRAWSAVPGGGATVVGGEAVGAAGTVGAARVVGAVGADAADPTVVTVGGRGAPEVPGSGAAVAPAHTSAPIPSAPTAPVAAVPVAAVSAPAQEEQAPAPAPAHAWSAAPAHAGSPARAHSRVAGPAHGAAGAPVAARVTAPVAGPAAAAAPALLGVAPARRALLGTESGEGGGTSGTGAATSTAAAAATGVLTAVAVSAVAASGPRWQPPTPPAVPDAAPQAPGSTWAPPPPPARRGGTTPRL